MFALKQWRSVAPVITRRAYPVARYSQAAGSIPSSTSPTQESEKIPLAEVDANPPTPGPDGYPPPRPPKSPNPLQERNVSPINQTIQTKPKYRLHCHSTRNNTITTLTRPNGSPIAWFSGGSCGFKKANRASYEAGYQCAVRMFKTIEELAKTHPMQIELFFKGFGQGRDALHKALLTSEGSFVRPIVCTITDRTAIKIGGTRAKKVRRL